MSATKDAIEQLLHKGRNITEFLTANRSRAVKWQEKTLRKLLFKARNTEFGKAHDFEKILIARDPYAEFRRIVPVSNYSTMHPWWQREFKGETDITWPGRAKYFALSSGTTEGSSKYIPVTQDGLKSMMRASWRELFAVWKTDVPKDFFAKQYLILGGSTDLEWNGTNYSGDLSGIQSANVPPWLERFAIPDEDILSLRDWNVKLEKMVEKAPEWDVVMVTGAPAWVKMLFEKIIDRYNLKSIHDIWPNYSVCTWGAVSLTPYRAALEAMCSKPVKYIGSYLASEGFVAFQTKPDAPGFRMVFKNNIFFEFIPFTEKNFNSEGGLLPDAEVIDLSQVEEDKDYAILLTTCSGAWRYLLGDTIRFVDVESCEIRITGRTRQFLSLCGEHLSVDNMNEGVRRTAEELGTHFPEFTVKGEKAGGEMGHRWFVACDKPLDAETVRATLDKHLCDLNDDYAVERRHVLTRMTMELLPESVFIGWMARHNKLGGQSKFPRVLADAMYDDWLQYLESISTAVV